MGCDLFLPRQFSMGKSDLHNYDGRMEMGRGLYACMDKTTGQKSGIFCRVAWNIGASGLFFAWNRIGRGKAVFRSGAFRRFRRGRSRLWHGRSRLPSRNHDRLSSDRRFVLYLALCCRGCGYFFRGLYTSACEACRDALVPAPCIDGAARDLGSGVSKTQRWGRPRYYARVSGCGSGRRVRVSVRTCAPPGTDDE